MVQSSCWVIKKKWLPSAVSCYNKSMNDSSHTAPKHAATDIAFTEILPDGTHVERTARGEIPGSIGDAGAVVSDFVKKEKWLGKKGIAFAVGVFAAGLTAYGLNKIGGGKNTSNS